MTRGVGEIELLQSVLGPLVPLFAVVTLFGGVRVYFALLAPTYWLGDRLPLGASALTREDVAQVVAMGLGALAVTATLKGVFAMPRPPGAGQPLPTDGLPGPLAGLVAAGSVADGFGFPSGHALGATAVYGSLGWVLARPDDEPGRERLRRGPLLVAALVAGLVGLSRVVIGVHYAVDVLAGFAVGVAFLAVAFRVAPTPRRSFPLVAALSAVGLAVVGPTRYLVLGLGWAVAATVAWWGLEDRIPDRPGSTRETAVALALGVTFVGIPFALVAALDPTGVVALLANGAILVAMLAIPVAAATLTSRTVA